jgi:hypothetical protein
LRDQIYAWLCDVSVVLDLVLELVILNKVVEFVEARSSRFVDVLVRFVVGEYVVYTASTRAFLVASLQALESRLPSCQQKPGCRYTHYYLCFIWSLDLNTDQVQVFIVESLVDLTVLAFLPATPLALSIIVLFILLIYDKACTFLLFQSAKQCKSWLVSDSVPLLFVHRRPRLPPRSSRRDH